MHYGWACINNTTYLKDSKSGKKYGTIIKSEGLPVSPAKYQFTKETLIPQHFDLTLFISS